MDRGAWWSAVQRGCKESDTTEGLSTYTFLIVESFRQKKHGHAVLVTQSCPTLSDPWTVASQTHPWDFPSKNTGAGCHFLLQGIFLSQGLNLGLLHCRKMLHSLSHQGSPGHAEVLSYERAWHSQLRKEDPNGYYTEQGI